MREIERENNIIHMYCFRCEGNCENIIYMYCFIVLRVLLLNIT